MNKSVLKFAAVAVAVVAIGYGLIWKWMICRVYVDPGQTLVISSKFGAENPDPENMRVVPEGMKGIRAEVLGEGRHFFSPLSYSVDTSPKVVEIKPDEIGLVESLSGKPLPPGQFLADEGYKGIQRRVLTPGRWRVNTFSHRVTKMPATIIKPGHVGCVTALSGEHSGEGQLAGDNQRGIRKNVLQPGIYYLNPREFQVESVEIGYRSLTLENVSFPSKDGFTIQLDITVVWGLLPRDVPVIINRFGNVEAVVDKIVRPQVESLCRIEGSKYGAKDFIEGTTREQFQNSFTQQLVKEARDRNIDVLIGLVRDIHVPMELREPIQKSKIAAEEQLTKEEQRKTQVVQNELEELRAEVTKGVREVAAETEKMTAEIKAEGDRKITTIRGEKEVAVAEIMKKVAELEAERQRILGKADADVIELLQKAEADRFQKNVAAMGDPEAYANYIFATSLPDGLKIFLRYSGVGTFWTDLPPGAKDLEKAAHLKFLEKDQQAAKEK